MTTQLSDFHVQVTKRLAALPQVGAAAREALGGPDLDRALSAALATIDQLKSPSRVVIELNPVAGQPDITADRPVHVAVLRSGADLLELGDEDIFTMSVDKETRSFAGHRESAMIAPTETSNVFEAVDRHIEIGVWRANARRAGAFSCRYRVEWLEGYVATEPAEHDLNWFDPVNVKGFDLECLNALIDLQLNDSYDSVGVTDRVRMTRIA